MISTTVVIVYCLLKPYAATQIILLQLFTLSGGSRGGTRGPLILGEIQYNTIPYHTIRLYFTTLATHNKSWFPGGA